MICCFFLGEKNLSSYMKTVLQQTFLNSFRRINTKRPKHKQLKNRQKENRNNITQRNERINKNNTFNNKVIEKDKLLKKNDSQIHEEKERQKELQKKEIRRILDKTQNLISQINKIKINYPSPPKRNNEVSESDFQRITPFI